MRRRRKRPVVLIIASSDSGGGAGLQADSRTASALGCYTTMTIVALTAQNTCGVQDIYPISKEFVRKQLEAIFTDIECDAIKIGMLHNADIIKTVAEFLSHYKTPQQHLIIDPVFVATSGDMLIEKPAVAILEKKLLPLASLITPNHLEAEVLSETKIKSFLQMEKAAENLATKYGVNVLLKGGDFSAGKEARDVSVSFMSKAFSRTSFPLEKKIISRWYVSKRIASNRLHGTGCTLSTAIACYMSMGFEMSAAIKKAKRFITCAIKSPYTQHIGKGRVKPVDSLYNG